MKRIPESRRRSARKFNAGASRTRRENIAARRGGWRL